MPGYCIKQGCSLRLLERIPSGLVGCVLTDPPYSSGGANLREKGKAVGAKYQNTKTEKTYPEFFGDSRDQRGLLVFLTTAFSLCWEACKDGAPIMVFADWRNLAVTIDAIQAGGFMYRGLVPWDKTEAARPQPGRFTQQCEFVVWGSKGGFNRALLALAETVDNMRCFVWTPEESGARTLADKHAEIIGANALQATLAYALERQLYQIKRGTEN